MDELRMLFKQMNSKPVVIHTAYVRLLKGWPEAAVLSQLVYWWYAMDEQEFYKTDEDLLNELPEISARHLTKIKTVLKAQPFLKTRLRGAPPKTFYSIDVDALITALIALKAPEFSIQRGVLNRDSETQGQFSTDSEIESAPDAKSYTESTSEKLASELGRSAAPEIPAEEGGSLSGTNARSAFRSALDSLLDCGDALETLTAKNKARVVLGFYDRVATHKKLTNGGSVKLLEVIQKSLEKGVDAEEMIHAMWRLQHCSFATDGVKWKNKWDLYYLLERKQQDKVDVALNKFSPDTATLDEQWSAIQPFQRLLSSPLTRYVRPAQSQSGGKDYSALARKPAGVVGAAK